MDGLSDILVHNDSLVSVCSSGLELDLHLAGRFSMVW